MSHYFTPQNIFDLCIALGGLGYIIAQVKIGKSKKKSDDDSDALTTIKIKDLTIETLQKESAELKEKNKKDGVEFNERLTRQGERVAVLEADNKRLEALVANRNPELENFMKNTAASILIIESTLATLLKLHQTPSTTVINNQPA